MKQYLFAISLLISAITMIPALSSSQTLQWERLNGPHGGNVTVIGEAPSGRIIVAAGQNQEGVKVSDDGGVTWQSSNTGISLTDREFKCMITNDSGHVFLGTGSHIGSATYKSADEGNTWSLIAPMTANEFAVDQSGVIYAVGTAYGEYRTSSDGGASWVTHAHPAPGLYCIAINDSGHIFMGGNYTAYRSTDNGLSWTNLTGINNEIQEIAVAPNGDLFVVSNEFGNVFRSSDNGDTWINVTTGKYVAGTSKNLVIDASGIIYLGTSNNGMWKSVDNGNTWSQINSGLQHTAVRNLFVSSATTLFTGTEGGGVYRSLNQGLNWSQTGIQVSYVYDLETDTFSNRIYAAVNGVSYSDDNGQSWLPANSGLNNLSVNKILVVDDSTIFAGCSFAFNDPGVIFRSDDNGASWLRKDASIPLNTTVRAMAKGLAGEIFAGTYEGVYVSYDRGDTWSPYGTSYSFSTATGMGLNSSGDLFVSTWGAGTWRRLHNDTTWVNITAGTGNYFSSLFITSGDLIFAEGLRSDDNGNTWTSVFGNSVSGIAENSAGHLFMGTFNFGSGVYRSSDDGLTWVQENAGLTIQDIRSLAVDATDNLYAGTYGQAAFKTATLSSLPDIAITPTGHELFITAFPNPADSWVEIIYYSTTQSNIKISLLDMAGREIMTAIDDGNESGLRRRLIQTNGIPNGMYHLMIKNQNDVKSCSVMIAR